MRRSLMASKKGFWKDIVEVEADGLVESLGMDEEKDAEGGSEEATMGTGAAL